MLPLPLKTNRKLPPREHSSPITIRSRPDAMSKQNRLTVFIPEADSPVLEPATLNKRDAGCPRSHTQISPQQGNAVADPLPVFSETPWKHYKQVFALKFWCPFSIITSADLRGDVRMMRTIHSKTEEQLHAIRQAFHPNVVHNLALYASPGSNHFLVSEYMPTSLLHLVRAPVYPSEAQLSSILHQVCFKSPDTIWPSNIDINARYFAGCSISSTWT